MKRATISIDGLGKKTKTFVFEHYSILEEGLIRFQLNDKSIRYYSIRRIRQLDIYESEVKEVK